MVTFKALPLLAFVMLGIVSPNVAADWPMPGYDGARTSLSASEGPRIFDLVIDEPLTPGFRLPAQPVDPIVVDGKVWVLLPEDAGSTSFVYTFDLKTGQTKQFVQVGFSARHLLAHGEDVVLLGGNRIEIYARQDASLSYAGVFDAVPDPTLYMGTECRGPTVRAAVLFVPCTELVSQDKVTVLHALDLSSHEPLWPPVIREGSADQPPTTYAAAQQSLLAAPGRKSSMTTVVVGASVVGKVIAVVTNDPVSTNLDAGVTQSVLWVVERESGKPLWSRAVPQIEQQGFEPNQSPLVTGDERALYFEADYLLALDPATGADLEFRDFREDVGEGDVGSGLAFGNDRLFATSINRLTAFNPKLGVVWTYSLPGGQRWEAGPPAIVGSNLYALARTPDNVNVLHVLEASTGRELQDRPFQSRISFVVDSGVLAVLDPDGRLRVLGLTTASIHPLLTVSLPYPGPGDVVEVDLSASLAGARGPATQFRADWGDGTVTDWQNQSRLSHRFGAPIDAVATFEMRNAAGQTATIRHTFHVGRQQELTLLQQQFAAENQDRTFFLIGLFLTALGAAIGVLRLRRRRGRVHQELHAIEDAYRRTLPRPGHCERALAERRAHVHGLLSDGKIDEAQLHLFERRIDQLSRTLRMSALEGKFDFLPFGMVRALQGMLEDGHINRWEHDHFLLALDQDRLLTPDQKKRVRGLIDEWFEADSNGVIA